MLVAIVALTMVPLDLRPDIPIPHGIEHDATILVAGFLFGIACIGREWMADYLCAVMNSAVTTEILRPFMSYGKDERDIHKHVWQLPIEPYDPENPTHLRPVELGRAATRIAAAFEVEPSLHFSATRRHMRERLEASEVGSEISQIVDEMLL
jgi:hypothetical protein